MENFRVAILPLVLKLLRLTGLRCKKNFKAQHSLWAKIWFSKKVDLVGYDLIFKSVLLVDQRSPNFIYQRRKNRARSGTCSILDIFFSCWRYSPSKFEVVHNRATFRHVFGH